MDDPNRRHHTFGEPRHNLESLVRQYCGEERAGQAIENAVTAAFEDGELVLDGDGLYRQVFDIGGHSVTVSGRVIDGVVHIATAWISLKQRG
jgi:hypothetical protein